MSLIIGFLGFWYDFIVGDAWEIALGVIIVLTLGAALLRTNSVDPEIVRLLVAAGHRSGIIWGYALASLVRWSLVAVLLSIVALLAHMQVGGNGVDLFGLYALAMIVNLVGLLWACGVAMRFRSVQAGPLMQTPVFLILFLAPVYVSNSMCAGKIHRRDLWSFI